MEFDGRKITNMLVIISIVLFIGGAIFIFFFLKSDNSVKTDIPTARPQLPINQPESTVNRRPTSQIPTQQIQLPENPFANIENQIESEEKNYILIQLFSSPVAGFAIQENNERKFVRLVERSTGNLYDVDLTNTPPASSLITNTLIPQSHYANISGDYVAIEYYDTQENSFSTILGKIKNIENKPSSITGISVGKVDWLTRGKNEDGKFFYLKNRGFGVDGIVFDVKNETRTRVFTSLASAWIPFYSSDSKLGLLTKPSIYSIGSFFLYNLIGGSNRKVISGLGLSVMPNKDITEFVYSYFNNNDFVTGLFKINGGSEDFTFRTLSEKCAISDINIICGVPFSTETFVNGALLPDGWYQGVVSFNDLFVVFSKEDKLVESLFDQEELTTSIDVYEPQISDEGNVFVFKNKNDESLWAIIKK